VLEAEMFERDTMDEQNYVLKVGFFVDGSPERLAPFGARVSLGPFRRPLTNSEIQDILYAAKVRYLEIVRGDGAAVRAAGGAGGDI